MYTMSRAEYLSRDVLNVEAGQHHASTIIIIAESGKFFFFCKQITVYYTTCSYSDKSENQRVASLVL